MCVLVVACLVSSHGVVQLRSVLSLSIFFNAFLLVHRQDMQDGGTRPTARRCATEEEGACEYQGGIKCVSITIGMKTGSISLCSTTDKLNSWKTCCPRSLPGCLGLFVTFGSFPKRSLVVWRYSLLTGEFVIHTYSRVIRSPSKPSCAAASV